ncbi:lipopolysaccharide biosynthesis protein [Streptomyces sp. NPDC004126]|uniref:lipopolysaccharide biosynthesis protein n=1 Tax=Streptomyces sp. NPDC004126 TaxID=3390695 RepID=UPI003D05941B
MTETNRPATAPAEDEPDLLRDQFKQLLRYRRLLGAGLAVGLLGGVYLGVSTADTYVSVADVVLRAPTDDPFNPSLAPDKAINIGSERQVALSRSIAEQAAKTLGVAAKDVPAFRGGLQVTNPPQTMVLRFTYTAASPKEAARRANGMAAAYLLKRQEALDVTRTTMVKGYEAQRDPVAKQLDEVARQINSMPAGNARDASLSSRTDLQNKVNTLNGNIAKLQALDMTPGRVTTAAAPPAAADGPGLPMSLALGAAVGLALGLLAAWVRLVFDPAPRSEGDVARSLRAPVLGYLPRDRTGGGPLLAAGEADPRLAEEYRSVAFRLAYDSRFADRRRLLVAAPRGSSETAAAVAVNLAASFAETGKDVLLIEADLRTPVLASQLPTDTGDRPRWSSLSGGSAGGDSEWPDGRRVVVDAAESGDFDLIPGDRVRNVARALTSRRTGQLIAEADTPNSTVVVLAPPVLSYADALALVDRVDGVLVVCDPRAVHRSDLSRIRELISGAGGTVLGAVLHAPLPSPKRGSKGGAKGGSKGGAAGDGESAPGDGSDTVALRTVRTGQR